MITLSREIRFALVSGHELALQRDDSRMKNSWAGWPATNRLVPQLTLSAVVEGEPDARTGYLCNVAVLDDRLRGFVFDHLVAGYGNATFTELPGAESIVRMAFENLQRYEDFDGAVLRSVCLAVSPQLSFRIQSENSKMLQLTHQFEFSAAHRLHCDSLSAEENRSLFGKCNNPNGHGHNYVVEVTVSGERSSGNDQGVVMPVGELARIVNANVIDPLDHTHLNEDVEYFSKVNPSVENICVAIYQWLCAEIESAGCCLTQVKVYETPKTWACYSG